MKLKIFFIYTQALLSLLSIFSSTSFAFNLSILKNDKENISHAYRSSDLKIAQEKIQSLGNYPVSDKAFQLLGLSLNEISNGGNLCDLNLIQNFSTKLEKVQIPNDHQTLLNFLTIWRSQDLIDDIFFEILKQSSALNASLADFNANKISPSEARSAEKFINNKKITPTILIQLVQKIWAAPWIHG